VVLMHTTLPSELSGSSDTSFTSTVGSKVPMLCLGSGSSGEPTSRAAASALDSCRASAYLQHSMSHSKACQYVVPTVMIPFGLGILSLR
jgi:hypothetical protein